MKPKVYVASSFLNKDAARRAMRTLEKWDFVVTSRWTKHRPSINFQVLRQEAVKDLDDLRAAEVLVVIWPGRRGTDAEIGAALAMSKPVFMIGKPPREESVYYNHPDVRILPSLLDFKTFIQTLWKT